MCMLILIPLLHGHNIHNFFSDNDYKDDNKQTYKKVHSSLEILSDKYIRNLPNHQYANKRENKKYFKIPLSGNDKNKDDP